VKNRIAKLGNPMYKANYPSAEAWNAIAKEQKMTNFQKVSAATAILALSAILVLVTHSPPKQNYRTEENVRQAVEAAEFAQKIFDVQKVSPSQSDVTEATRDAAVATASRDGKHDQ